MNTLVIYDSQFGNTERVARSIAAALEEFGEARVMQVGQVRPGELSGVDLLICGSPTQGMRSSPAMQSFLQNLPRTALNGMAVACFDTRFRAPQWLWKHSLCRAGYGQALACTGCRLPGAAGEFLRREHEAGRSPADR